MKNRHTFRNDDPKNMGINLLEPLHKQWVSVSYDRTPSQTTIHLYIICVVAYGIRGMGL